MVSLMFKSSEERKASQTLNACSPVKAFQRLEDSCEHTSIRTPKASKESKENKVSVLDKPSCTCETSWKEYSSAFPNLLGMGHVPSGKRNAILFLKYSGTPKSGSGENNDFRHIPHPPFLIGYMKNLKMSNSSMPRRIRSRQLFLMFAVSIPSYLYASFSLMVPPSEGCHQRRATRNPMAFIIQELVDVIMFNLASQTLCVQ
jgi:hypothetical protein